MAQAKILSKFVSDYYNQRAFTQSGQVEIGLTEKGKLYKLLLENEENKEQKYELVTSQYVYNKVKEGDVARLVFRGEELIRFGELGDRKRRGSSFVGIDQDFEE